MASPTLKINFYNDRVVSVSFLNPKLHSVPGVVNFTNVFLRDASDSLDSVNPISKQKLFSTGQISRAIKAAKDPKVIEVNNDDGTKEYALEIHWTDGNVSIYKESFLEKYSCHENRYHGKYFEGEWVLWDNEIITKKEKDLYLDYDDYMNDEKSLLKAIVLLNKFGLVFIKNVPPQLDKSGKSTTNDWFVEKIAQKIGYIRETFYGRTWDVQSKKEAENIAYTNSYLGLHMDLMYYDSPPQLQLLHSIVNKVKGGESFFVDSYNSVQFVREKDPQAYSALTEIPINYHYENNGESYFQSRPLIVEDHKTIDPRTESPLIREVNYSPPFQAPFEHGITSPLKKIGEFENLSQMDINYHHTAISSGDRHVFKDFHRGLQLYEEHINKPENQYRLKLEEGMCVIFNNRRVLHAREKFEGLDNRTDLLHQRWFKGTYIDTDAFYSKMRVLYKKYNHEEYY